MRKLLAALGLASSLMVGCMPPQTPTDKLTDSAWSMVEAARFGRMDIMISSVQPAQQEAYADAHAEWGGNIRILDIEYGGAKLVKADKAVVLMTVAWQRLDESSLRQSSVKQTWTLGGDRWLISEEVISGGDKELLKAPVKDGDDAKPKSDKKSARGEKTGG